MENSKEIIIAIVENSSLSQEQKNLWHNFLKTINEELAAHLVETIQQDENSLGILTENIEDKIKALSTDSEEDLSKVIQKEKTILEETTD